jgi:hypothetical protein
MTPPAAPPSHDVFVSYRWVSPEQEWVRDALAPALRAAGLKPIVDVEDFVPGRDLTLEMQRAVQTSRHTLCVVTPAFCDGERKSHLETLLTRDRDPTGAASALVPLLLKTAELPLWMRTLVPVDWREPAARVREWGKLLDLLGAPRRDVPPPGSPFDEPAAPPAARAPAPAAVPGTGITDGVVRIALGDAGEVIGGTGALRRVVAELLLGHWAGRVEVRDARMDAMQQELTSLRALEDFDAEQGGRLARLSQDVRTVAAWHGTLCAAWRLSFTPNPDRELTWGVPMDTEAALAFVQGLLAALHLGAPTLPRQVPCQLFLPRSIDDPLAVDLALPEAEVRAMRESWTAELGPYDPNQWRSWHWPDLVPLWHLSNRQIATLCLPALAARLAGRVNHLNAGDAAAQWQALRESLAAAERDDPLTPFGWCLALDSRQRSSKDLAWQVAPPRARYLLPEVLARRRR